MFEITTATVGNPDHGQDPNRPLLGAVHRTIKAASLSALVRKVRKWQAANDVGGGNWIPPAVMKDGNSIGRMSYNGRVWPEAA